MPLIKLPKLPNLNPFNRNKPKGKPISKGGKGVPAKGMSPFSKQPAQAFNKQPIKYSPPPPISQPSSQNFTPSPISYSPPPPSKQLSWWDQLSAERKLDVVGIILAFVGVVLILGLASANRSALLGGFIKVLAQFFGWGIYVLPIGLIIVGLWLVFRKIEKIPPISVERVTGIILFFFWLLGVMHSIIAEPEMAEVAALDGVGGGYFGGLIERILFFSFGAGGAIVSFVAWAIIALSLTLDTSVQNLFKWVIPLLLLIQSIWKKPTPQPTPQPADMLPDGIPPLADSDSEPSDALVPVSEPITTIPAVIHWELPKVSDILDTGNAPSVNEEFIQQRARLIEETLASFGAPAQVVAISRGPSITQFGVEPLFVETRGGVRTRVRVSKIASLSDDLALALAAPRIRIQAPVPGHSYVGIEVPNEEMALVALREIVESDSYVRNQKALTFGLGRDVAGHPIIANLESMPHILIAGTTGSGKSVCVNAILTCFLMDNTPDDLRLVLIDPKRVELTGYNGIPHLLGPVVVEMDRVIGALQWMTREMDKRYHMFAQNGSRNIIDFNAKEIAKGQKKLPYLVIVIDELADLMMIAAEETEKTITRLAQLARATGIHMILATQRPSVDVVTGLIKANFPARIAFAVASNTDSRVILDQPGAERLLGRGDMLFQAPDAASAARLQGVFVSDQEIHKLTDYWRVQAGGGKTIPNSDSTPADSVPQGVPLKQQPLWEASGKSDSDPLFPDAVELVRKEGRASVSMLQRRMRIGYTRAARIVDNMEDKGIVGPPEGATQLRKILDYGPTAPPKDDGA